MEQGRGPSSPTCGDTIEMIVFLQFDRGLEGPRPSKTGEGTSF